MMTRPWPLAALSGLTALIALSGCPEPRECAFYNDCPDNSYCTDDGQCAELVPCDLERRGTISGRVTTPGGGAPVIGAQVEIVGEMPVVTDANGEFTLEVDPGAHEITAKRNDFFGKDTVEVCGGVDLDFQIDVQPPEHSMAVVDGDYDSIEDVLRKIGLEADVHFDFITEDALSDADALAGYRILFLNCTNSPVADAPGVTTTLQAFVQGGGRVYASDWSYTYVEAAWPDKITFVDEAAGDFGPKIGQVVTSGATANVLDPTLASYLGKSEVELAYDLGAWVVMESASDTSGIVVTTGPGFEGVGPALDAPLMTQFNVGAGRVIYTTFHNEAQTTQDMDTILTYLVFSL